MENPNPHHMLLVIGSYTKPVGPGIHFYKLEDSGEAFVPAGNIAGIENPSYLLVSAETSSIYAITENKENTEGELRVYQVQKDGQPAMVTESIPFEGAGSCYVSTDARRIHAFITNYGGGTLTVLRLPHEGIAGGMVQQLHFSGSGPNRERQDGPHPHAALLSKDERYLFCTDLGGDRLYRFPYASQADPPLQAQQRLVVPLPPGSGPRHLAFSPDGRWLYLITELSGEIFVFNANELNGGWLQRLPITQEGYSGKIGGGDIQVHAGGRFLYASNRGDANEIVVFSIDQVSGQLDFLQRIGAAGLSPRNLLICEEQAFLLAANEQSDNVSIFKLKDDGSLEFTKKHLQVPAPACLKKMERSTI